MAQERKMKHDQAMEQIRLQKEKELAKLSNKEVEKTKKAAKNLKEFNEEKLAEI
jgi:hypothetical protein